MKADLPPREVLRHLIYWTRIQGNMDGRQIKEKILPSYNTYDCTHIQNNNSSKTLWY